MIARCLQSSSKTVNAWRQMQDLPYLCSRQHLTEYMSNMLQTIVTLQPNTCKNKNCAGAGASADTGAAWIVHLDVVSLLPVFFHIALACTFYRLGFPQLKQQQ